MTSTTKLSFAALALGLALAGAPALYAQEGSAPQRRRFPGCKIKVA